MRVWPYVLGFTAWAALVAVAEWLGLVPGRISPVPFTFIGLPLGFFLAFRGNQGHARYWEALRHWTTVCNCSRNVARQTDVFLSGGDAPPPELLELRRSLLGRVIAVLHAMRARLQGADEAAAAAKALAEMQLALPPSALDAHNMPYALLTSITRDLDRALRAGWVDRVFVRYIDAQATLLADAFAACEKIRDTPLPVPIVLLTRRMVLLYAVGLPVGIVDMTGWFCPVVTGVIVFAFLGLDVIAGELAAPFASGPHQLPLLTTTMQVERDVRHLMGLPAQPLPEATDGIVV